MKAQHGCIDCYAAMICVEFQSNGTITQSPQPQASKGKAKIIEEIPEGQSHIHASQGMGPVHDEYSYCLWNFYTWQVFYLLLFGKTFQPFFALQEWYSLLWTIWSSSWLQFMLVFSKQERFTRTSKDSGQFCIMSSIVWQVIVRELHLRPI